VVSLFVGRIAQQMLTVAFVLFVLARYHSPQLAGAATFLLLVPGLCLSPIAGALLDRYSRTRMIMVDNLVIAATLFGLAGLSASNLLAPPLLLAISAAASLTGPLGTAGARAIFPILVPGDLWERANALDNSGSVLSSVIGAPLAGLPGKAANRAHGEHGNPPSCAEGALGASQQSAGGGVPEWPRDETLYQDETRNRPRLIAGKPTGRGWWTAWRPAWTNRRRAARK